VCKGSDPFQLFTLVKLGGLGGADNDWGGGGKVKGGGQKIYIRGLEEWRELFSAGGNRLIPSLSAASHGEVKTEGEEGTLKTRTGGESLSSCFWNRSHFGHLKSATWISMAFCSYDFPPSTLGERGCRGI